MFAERLIEGNLPILLLHISCVLQGPSARKLALACLTEIITECDIEDNRTAPLPETAETVPGEAFSEVKDDLTLLCLIQH